MTFIFKVQNPHLINVSFCLNSRGKCYLKKQNYSQHTDKQLNEIILRITVIKVVNYPKVIEQHMQIVELNTLKLNFSI